MEKIYDALSEYSLFIRTHLLPLIGVSHDNNLIPVEKSGENISNLFIRQEKDKLVFSSQDRDVFYLNLKRKLPEDSIALARKIIPAFFASSKFKFAGSASFPNISYPSNEIYEENIKLALQRGILDWCLGKRSPAFYKFFQIIEQWAVRTYEGKKVTFGFVINPRAKSSFPQDDYGTWTEFINDDYAATLSDCIHSVIEIDEDCNFSRYLSITEGGAIEEYTLSDKLPYRFARVIDKYVKGDCVGVFLLNNGDIILSKKRSIKLIKRNLKWLNLGFEAFQSAVDTKKKHINIPIDLLKHIYASTLDVSFSHTGGIISVISDISQLTESNSGSAPILNGCDNLLSGKDLLTIDAEMKDDPLSKKLSNSERNKRLLKRKAILTLVNGKSFTQLDRKLRTELISMDGACIMDTAGNVYSFGSIIQNDSGSAGGGRSAAAKKLSNYGMAIKVSTDGYIELFINGESVYAVK